MSIAERPETRRLQIDAAAVSKTIEAALRRQVGESLRRSGIVVAMSGGVDSSVVAALAARAVGPRRVLGLALPERESSPESLKLARNWAADLGIEFLTEDISRMLNGCECYARRDAAIRRLVPEYGEGWRVKLGVDASGDSDRLSLAYLVVQPPDGASFRVHTPARELREIVAATNYKQRARAMVAYYHADRMHYAVAGTPNRLEYDQGFFVKGGDGLADVKPIAHLYKTQVYRLAEHLGVPGAIIDRPPTTDTYPLHQTQDEFYFALPLEELDLVLFAVNSGEGQDALATELGRPAEEVRRAWREIARRREAAKYLHAGALLVGDPASAAELEAVS